MPVRVQLSFRLPLIYLMMVAVLALTACAGGGSFNAADVRFMQSMIPHHAQAVEMAKLVPDRTKRPELVELSQSIVRSQSQEIDRMRQLLAQAGAKPADAGGAEHGGMHGMMRPHQLQQLASASGAEFERMFLDMMTTHHLGAVETTAGA
jgi:uncharacterized protein (DUF305 family)